MNEVEKSLERLAEVAGRSLPLGRMRITTASGSVYVVDTATETLSRAPGVGASSLRRDDETLKLYEVMQLEVGKIAGFLIQVRTDDVPTVRITTPVTSIEELSE